MNRRSKIQNVYIHSHPNLDLTEFKRRVDKSYADIFERYLDKSTLSKEQKAALIEKLIALYKA